MLNKKFKSITFPISACQGANTTLTNTTTGGFWTSNDLTIATIGSASGTVNGVAAGTVTVSYTLGTGCYSTNVLTINPLPIAITGANNVCVGSSITLTDTTTGGTWLSSNVAMATIGNTTGIVNGVLAGSAIITYKLGNGCQTASLITVNPLPAAITGTLNTCLGLTTSLTDVTPGGNWSTASVNMSVVGTTGVVTGLSAGTGMVTYVVSTGCFKTAVVTVNSLPAPITGASSVCANSSTTLSNATTGGTWSSGNTAVATIGSLTGIMNGITSGTSVITYKLATGCLITAVELVNPLPAAIGGPTTVCANSSIILTNATSGGSWSSLSANLNVNSVSGNVTGVTVGTGIVSYTLPTGCINTSVVRVNPLPASISGATGVCAASSTTLTDATTGGAWSSSDVTVATVTSTTGLVNGLIAGSATITYQLTSGCYNTTTISVNPQPSAISGTGNLCVLSSIALSTSSTGGNWVSSNTAIATVGSTGVVTGAGVGNIAISYVLPTGCYTSTTMAVNPVPSPITGTPSICANTNSTLSDASFGGAWSSSDITIASIGSTTGVMSGISAGSAIITYRMTGGCYVTKPITILLTPAAITGSPNLCVSSAITLSDLTSGGVWTSSGSGAATINTISGLVSGVSIGTTLVTYTISSGCIATTTVTVYNSAAPITGIRSMCAGQSYTLADAATGGLWSSSNAAIASIGSYSGIVTGMSSGTATITYSLGGGCVATASITVSAFSTIIGTTTVCLGSSTVLSDSATGGLWTSSNPAVAAVNCNLGIVNGVSVGTSIITYSLGTGCTATIPVTVVALGANTGLAAVCAGSTTTLSNTTSGGTWVSSNTAIATVGTATGIVAGVTTGNAVITYSLGNGCYAKTTINVLTLPANTGIASVCPGSTTTINNTIVGGTWSTSDPTIATVVSGTGVVTGIAAGVATITYRFGSSCIATTPITINALPGTVTVSGGGTSCGSATITASGGGGATIYFQGTTSGGTSTAIASASQVVTTSGTYYFRAMSASGCWGAEGSTSVVIPVINGGTTICLGTSSTLSLAGATGTWSSSNPSIASVNATTGIVTGVANGVATITATAVSGCVITAVVTVQATAPAITGPGVVCLGQKITLASTGLGGIWSSGSPTIATVGTTGIVSGIAAGLRASITYSINASCKSIFSVSVTALSPITGSSSVCLGQTITLGDATTGGTWSSSSSSISIGSVNGVVTGASAGTALISYTLPSGCITTTTVNVKVLSGISGPLSVCVGQNITLSDADAGGTWSSGSPTIATVGALTGIVTGVAGALNATITYTLGSGCHDTARITVNKLTPIVTAGSVCQGLTATVTDATLGGAWSTSSSSIATISSGGVVTGVNAGIVTISYILPTGCTSTANMFVNPVAAIVGPNHVCQGQSITLSDPAGAGTWSSSAPTVATIGTTGVVLGIAANLATNITYTFCTGCKTIATVSVNPLTPTSGPTTVCDGQTIILTNATTGGLWSSSNTSMATAGSTTGIITGVGVGSAIISYTLPTGCKSAYQVDELLLAPITGSTTVCQGQNVTLNNAVGGGLWYSPTPSIASIGSSSGIVSGVSGSHSIMISYTLSNGCRATTSLSVVAVPVVSAITGPGSVSISGTPVYLSDVTAGGLWSSSNTSVAGVVPASGMVTGITTGSVFISYTVTNSASCSAFVTRNITVGAAPAPHITTAKDVVNICIGSSVTLNNQVKGGEWSCNDGAGVIYVDPQTGIVTGIAAGRAMVSYTTISGVNTSIVITTVVVNPLPDEVLIKANPGTSVVTGQRVALTAAIMNGGTNPAYQWYVNKVAVPGANNYSYASSNYADGDVVTCTIGSTSGCGTHAVSGSVVISVGTLSVKPVAGDDRFALLPNPNKGDFKLSGSLLKTTNANVIIEITDMLGQQVYVGRAMAKNGKLDEHFNLGGNLANGMYILNLRAGDESAVFHFVVEQ